MENNISICGVLVTYNRIIKLKKALDSYSDQTIKPDCIIVVDNFSSDETPIYLEQWKAKEEGIKKIIIRLSENTGGAGGFSKGIEVAASLGYDWIFIGDDDAYLNSNLIEKFSRRKEVFCDEIGAIATTVDSPDGISFFHRRIAKKGLFTFKEIESTNNDYKKSSFNIHLFSFVGVFLKTSIVKTIELPKSKYFIWYDDSEYSYRFSKMKKVICIPELIVYHDCPRESIAFCWKSFYGYRNKLEMLKTDVGFRYYFVFKFLLWCSSILDSCFGNKEKGKTKRAAIEASRKGIFGKNNSFFPKQKNLS